MPQLSEQVQSLPVVCTATATHVSNLCMLRTVSAPLAVTLIPTKPDNVESTYGNSPDSAYTDKLYSMATEHKGHITPDDDRQSAST
jgi:hypothetical protein